MSVTTDQFIMGVALVLYVSVVIHAIYIIITKKANISGREVQDKEALVWGWGALIFSIFILLAFLILS